jgi:hypothetical protein
MQKISAKGISVLSLILIAVSAITAAIVPNSSNKILSDGTLKESSDGGNVVNTCIARTGANSCNVSVITRTTTIEQGDPNQSTETIEESSPQTVNNTTVGDI